MAGRVVVVGAGPSALALALQAHAHGGQLRVVERRTEWFRPSRALIMHPRTLEALRPLGVVDALLERAVVSPVVELHLGRRTVPAELESLCMNGTAFPHPILLRQTDVEAVLRQALESRGVAVELGTELVELQGTTAVLRHGQDRHQTSFDYLVGCDGANSTVRALLGVPWRGRVYRQEIVLADLDLDLAPAAPLLLRRRRLVDQGMARLAQFPIHYRSSPLSVEIRRPASGARAGRRLPDATVVCDGRTMQLHEMTAAPGFHVLLERSAPQYPAPASGPAVHVHRIASWPGAGGMVIRLDGYVGLRTIHIDEHQITSWLATATGRPSP